MGDLSDAEAVPGGAAVLEDAHLRGAQLDGLAVVRADHGTVLIASPS
jgi:hypothetical protein